MVDCLRLQESLCFRSRHVFSPRQPGEGVSTCRSKGLNGEWSERTYDYVIANHSLQENIKNMEVKEDFESRPHEAVFLGGKRQNSRREQKMPNATRNSAVESCQEEAWRKKEARKRKEKEGQEKKMDNEVIRKS